MDSRISYHSLPFLSLTVSRMVTVSPLFREPMMLLPSVVGALRRFTLLALTVAARAERDVLIMMTRVIRRVIRIFLCFLFFIVFSILC